MTVSLSGSRRRSTTVCVRSTSSTSHLMNRRARSSSGRGRTTATPSTYFTRCYLKARIISLSSKKVQTASFMVKMCSFHFEVREIGSGVRRYRPNLTVLCAIDRQLTIIKTSDHDMIVWSDWKSDHELSTEVLIVRHKERATKRWLISDDIRWLKGKQTTAGI